jgi:hypothetical protein
VLFFNSPEESRFPFIYAPESRSILSFFLSFFHIVSVSWAAWFQCFLSGKKTTQFISDDPFIIHTWPSWEVLCWFRCDFIDRFHMMKR